MAQRILIDLDYCTGCKSCNAACATVHPNGATVIERAGLKGETTFPLVCRHCDEPACATVCPKEAIKKNGDGTISRNSLLCVGCRSCAVACPFGVIGKELTSHVVSKCDLCAPRSSRGLEPACVAACPSGALRFSAVGEMAKDKTRFLVGSRMLARSPYVRRV